jgi:hypothetical protein
MTDQVAGILLVEIECSTFSSFFFFGKIKIFILFYFFEIECNTYFRNTLMKKSYIQSV